MDLTAAHPGHHHCRFRTLRRLTVPGPRVAAAVPLARTRHVVSEIELAPMLLRNLERPGRGSRDVHEHLADGTAFDRLVCVHDVAQREAVLG